MKNITKILFAIMAILLLTSNTLHAQKVSTYLKGTLQDADAVQSALKGAGFEVLGVDQVDTSGALKSVIFTCPTLKAAASTNDKGFAGALRVLINTKDNEIAITNPNYFLHAYLQKSYDDAAAQKVTKRLNSAFSGLQPSSDGLKSGDISGYHFMIGMPYYDDMDTVAKGSHTDLLTKIKAYNGGANIAFELKLSDNATLIGYKLSPDTADFIHTIGEKNAALLPYPILIEGDKARILAPKYYIALSYPTLKMTQFMKIASVPDAIEKDCANAFK